MLMKMCSSSSVLSVSLCLLLCLRPCLSSDVSQEMKVKPGEDTTLPCNSSGDAKVVLIRWIRPDLKSDGYILLYKNGRFQNHSLLQSYRGRVELKDPEMMGQDFSVVLKNVTFNDPGTYECRVGSKGNKPELISSINLIVQDSVNIRAEPGQSVSLPCRAPNNTEIVNVEWTRPGLEPEYIFVYRDGKPDPDNQHSSYQNRVELKDREMKDGDVSMILKNVNKDDSGRYECRVIYTKTKSRSRSILKTEPISIVHLEVQSGDTEENIGDEEGGVKEGGVKEEGVKDGGDKEGGNKGLYIGLGVALFVAAVVGGGFIFYRRCRKVTEQSSPDVCYTAAKTDQPADDAGGS